MRSDARQAYLLLTLATLFWAGNTIIARALSDTVPPITLAFLRWVVATLIVLPFAWTALKQDASLIRRALPQLFMFSVLGVSSFNTLLYHAAHTTGANNIALLQTAMPPFIVMLGWLLYREHASRLVIIGITLGMIGAAVIILHGDLDALATLQFVSGDMWMLLAVFLYALYSVLLPSRPPIQPMSFIFVTFALGALSLWPLYLWEAGNAAPVQWDGKIVAAIGYVALFASALAYFCWNRGLELVGAQRAGVFICFLPAFTAVLAALLLDEPLYSYHVVGAVFIIGGFILVNLRK